MGQTYSDLSGNPPLCTTLAFRDWYYDHLARRIAECPLERTTTYYFAQSGDDTTGDGSQATPWKTLAKAQAIHDASSGDIALLFKRGDTWEETTGLALTKTDVTVGAYGTGAKPLLNRFTVKYAISGGGWTNVTGTRYSRTENNDIAWVRRVANRLGAPISRASDNTGTGGTSGNWFYWASNTLTIDIGVDPNTVSLEAVISNSVSGVYASGDGCRIDSIRADGCGMHRTTTATQTEGIQSRASGTNAVLIYNCEAYYGSSHVLTHYLGSGSGGIVTIIHCKAGYTKYNSANESIFNFYSASGDNEAICHECECTYGTLPSADWVSASATRRGNAFYAHTNGPASALLLCWNCSAPASTWGPASPGFWGAYEPATLADCRAFFVGTDQELGDHTTLTSPGMAGVAQINCRYRIRPPQLATQGLTTGAQSGWLINCIFDWDMANATGTVAMYNTAVTTNNPRFWHCHINVYNATQTWAIDRDNRDNNTSTGSSDNAEIKNSIVAVTSSTTAALALANIVGQITNNAYYGLTASTGIRGWSNDPSPNVLVDAPVVGIGPTEADPFRQAGAAIGVEYDFYWRRRSSVTPSIGPMDNTVISEDVYGVLDMVEAIKAKVDLLTITDGAVEASIERIVGTPLTETTPGRIASNFETLLDNEDAESELTLAQLAAIYAKLPANDRAMAGAGDANTDLDDVVTQQGGTQVSADVVVDKRTWFAQDGYRASNIIEVKAGFAGTLALAPKLNPETAIVTVSSVVITGPASVTTSNLARQKSLLRANFDVPALSTVGTYTVKVTVTTTDSQTIPTTATLKVY